MTPDTIKAVALIVVAFAVIFGPLIVCAWVCRPYVPPISPDRLDMAIRKGRARV